MVQIISQVIAKIVIKFIIGQLLMKKEILGLCTKHGVKFNFRKHV